MKRHDAGERIASVEPILITEWGEFKVEGGVLFVKFASGGTPYVVAMGPAMAFEAIARAQKALSKGLVERLVGADANTNAH